MCDDVAIRSIVNRWGLIAQIGLTLTRVEDEAVLLMTQEY